VHLGFWVSLQARVARRTSCTDHGGGGGGGGGGSGGLHHLLVYDSLV